MKRLLLLRHAKAVAAGSKSGDHARALNERGRVDAPRIGVAMQHKRYLPQLVLCSTAKRTVETWGHVASELDATPEVKFLDELYLAPWKVIANAVRGSGDFAGVVLIVGHNPGLEECARTMARKPQSPEERSRLDVLVEKFPTAALAVLDFDIGEWGELGIGTGTLADFIRPKDINAG